MASPDVTVTITVKVDPAVIANLEQVTREIQSLIERLHEPGTPEAVNRYGKTAPELIAMAQQTVTGLRGADFSAPLADRLRREDCDHAWKVVHQLGGDLQPYCGLCWLIVLDGYRPYYTTPEGVGVKAEPKGGSGE